MNKVIYGDCLDVMKTLESESAHCCVTSPPYWGLRDYGIEGQLGLEKTPEEYIEKLVAVFREVKRVLRNDGTLWLNLGDTYCNKNLVGIPWRVAFALQADGWCLRQDIVWHKPKVVPESVQDRCTKAHEYIFLLSKSKRYYYDQDAIREPHSREWGNGKCGGSLNHAPRYTSNSLHKGAAWEHRGNHLPQQNPLGRNKRSVWTVNTKPLKEAHFATFPPDLIRPCILAGCPKGGAVLDPFFGAGTVGVVAKEEGRGYIGIELNPDYCDMALKRIAATPERLI